MVTREGAHRSSRESRNIPRPLVTREGAQRSIREPTAEPRPLVTREGAQRSSREQADIPRPLVTREGAQWSDREPEIDPRPVVTREGAHRSIREPAAEPRPLVTREGAQRSSREQADIPRPLVTREGAQRSDREPDIDPRPVVTREGAHRSSREPFVGQKAKGGRKRASDYSFTEPRAETQKESEPSGDRDVVVPGVTSRERKAAKRNEKRVDKANDADSSLLGKYLSCSIHDFLPEVLVGPDDFAVPPKSFIEAVEEVANSPVPTPKKSPVEFSTAKEALLKNSELLEAYDYDLERLLAAFPSTTLDPGSEFRPLEQLEKVLGSHPKFDSFRPILIEGMRYEFRRELSEEERIKELGAMLERGNHKSAKDDTAEVERLLGKDVEHGFSLPVLTSIVKKIKWAMVQPAGLASQFALQPDGSRVPKDRLTHDLTFEDSEGTSVNNRVDMDRYPDMIYGWCLLRVVHFIVALRAAFPNHRILIAKYDFSDAYRRVAHAAQAAAMSIIVLGSIAYIALRLAFGGSPNPPTWCCFSEMVTDLSNEIGICDHWDPDTLRSPAQSETPEPILVDESVPLAQARPMSVEIPIKATGRTDSFIDDLIRVFLDTEEGRKREPHAVPLAVHVTCRPHAGKEEPIPRRPILSETKLLAEGTPAEVQVVLGWDLDTRRLLILLPHDKYTAWSSDLEAIVKLGRVRFGELETVLGRLNHAGYIIPLSRHFLGRLQARLKIRRSTNQEFTLTGQEIEDLRLWINTFLPKARQGISLNTMTTRRPSQLIWSDSCPFGLGGLHLSGRAWRFPIPPESPLFGEDTANNFLEFLAMVANIWLLILYLDAAQAIEECILALGDSTSAIGWLFKSGKLPTNSLYFEAVQFVARRLATLILESSHCLASQHLQGEFNVVPDLLSFAGCQRGDPHPLASDFPSDDVLTQRFHTYAPQLIPPAFAISPLPSEISSFVLQALQIAESSWNQNRRRLSKGKTELGDGGSAFAEKPASPIISSFAASSVKNKSLPFDPSSPCTVSLIGTSPEPMKESVRSRWWHRLCAMPQAIWVRRSGTISNQVPFTSRTAPSSCHLSNPC